MYCPYVCEFIHDDGDRLGTEMFREIGDAQHRARQTVRANRGRVRVLLYAQRPDKTRELLSVVTHRMVS